jgi:hypothetical protein
LTVVHQVGLILVTGGTFHHSNPGLSRRSFRTPRPRICQPNPFQGVTAGARTTARLPEPLCRDACRRPSPWGWARGDQLLSRRPNPHPYVVLPSGDSKGESRFRPDDDAAIASSQVALNLGQ